MIILIRGVVLFENAGKRRKNRGKDSAVDNPMAVKFQTHLIFGSQLLGYS